MIDSGIRAHAQPSPKMIRCSSVRKLLIRTFISKFNSRAPTVNLLPENFNYFLNFGTRGSTNCVELHENQASEINFAEANFLEFTLLYYGKSGRFLYRSLTRKRFAHTPISLRGFRGEGRGNGKGASSP